MPAARASTARRSVSTELLLAGGRGGRQGEGVGRRRTGRVKRRQVGRQVRGQGGNVGAEAFHHAARQLIGAVVVVVSQVLAPVIERLPGLLGPERLVEHGAHG